MGKIVRNGIDYSTTSSNANNINYDNTLSGLTAVTAQEAIDELTENVSTLNDSLGQVKTYVGSDGKLHFVDASGADTVLPFNGLDSLNMLIIWYDRYSGFWFNAEIIKGVLKVTTDRNVAPTNGSSKYYLDNKIRTTYGNYWYSIIANADITLEIMRQSTASTSRVTQSYTAGQTIDGMTTNPQGDNVNWPCYTYRII